MSKVDEKGKSEQELHPEKFFLNPTGHIRDRIVIHDNPMIPKEGLFISLNGYAFLAKPNVEIDLPRPVRKMLDTRIQTDTQQDKDGKNYTRDIPRVSYTLIKADVKEGDVDGSIKVPDQESWANDAP